MAEKHSAARFHTLLFPARPLLLTLKELQEFSSQDLTC